MDTSGPTLGAWVLSRYDGFVKLDFANSKQRETLKKSMEYLGVSVGQEYNRSTLETPYTTQRIAQLHATVLLLLACYVHLYTHKCVCTVHVCVIGDVWGSWRAEGGGGGGAQGDGI